jgi:hypothetical protein
MVSARIQHAPSEMNAGFCPGPDAFGARGADALRGPTAVAPTRRPTGRTAPSPPIWRTRRRGTRRAGTIWRVSESFPELAQAVREHAQPDRIDIVRAKRHLLGQLGDGQPHPTSTLMASVAALLGAEPLAYPRVELPSRDSVTTLITADHPVPAPISPHARHWRNWPPRGC